MTRKAFWLLAFTGLRSRPSAQELPSQTVIAWRTGPAMNNQCPVCGTLTDPYILADAAHLIPCSHPKPGQACVAPLRRQLPPSRTVRCRRCNVRFDQDGV